jgi:hypothetical protein
MSSMHPIEIFSVPASKRLRFFISWCSCLIVYPPTNFVSCMFGCFCVLSCLGIGVSYFRYVKSLYRRCLGQACFQSKSRTVSAVSRRDSTEMKFYLYLQNISLRSFRAQGYGWLKATKKNYRKMYSRKFVALR